MRILWITRTASPRQRGGGADVYSEGCSGALAEAGAEVVMFGLTSGDSEVAAGEPAPSSAERRGAGSIAYEAVRAHERGTVPALLSLLPLVAARASPAALRTRLASVLAARRFDVAVLDNYAAGWALAAVTGGAGRPALPFVYVAHNDEAQLAHDIARAYRGSPLRRLALRLNARKIRRLEGRMMRQADGLVALTEHDRSSLAERNRRIPTLVVPPGYAGARRAERAITPETPRRVVMLGSVRWIAKQMNVAALLAEADARFAAAGITLDIIGDIPDEFRAEWEPRLRATRLRGFVDDLAGELEAARVGLIVEPTGGGFKLKTLDYVFGRVPAAILAGSCEGLPERLSDAMLIRPDLPALVSGVIEVVDDIPRLNGMHEAAITAAAGLFEWDANGRRMLDLVAGIARPGAAAAQHRSAAPLLERAAAPRGGRITADDHAVG